MAKDKDKEPVLGQPEHEETVTISKAELEALRTKQSDATQIASALANAILEARKPYVSPEQKANEDQFRDSMRLQHEAQQRQREWDQQNCPHIMACNPLSSTRDMFNRASFIKHRLDTGVEILLCTNCQRIVWPDDPDYVKYYNAHTTNTASSAGQRPQYVSTAWTVGRLNG